MEHNKSITEKERNELNEKYANVKLQKLAPRSEWVTVEEMRTILKNENTDFYSKKWQYLQKYLRNMTEQRRAELLEGLDEYYASRRDLLNENRSHEKNKNY